MKMQGSSGDDWKQIRKFLTSKDEQLAQMQTDQKMDRFTAVLELNHQNRLENNMQRMTGADDTFHMLGQIQ